VLNQVILVGRISDIIKKNGCIISMRVNVTRRNDDKTIDRPKVALPEAMGRSLFEKIKDKDGVMIGVKGRVETELKGRYGTISNIVAEKITLLEDDTQSNE
jgi:hypothetical protein